VRRGGAVGRAGNAHDATVSVGRRPARRSVTDAFSFRIGETQFLDLEGGPSFQFVDDSDGSGFEFGGNARLSYTLFLGRSLYWTLQPAFTRIGDVYTRGEVRTLLTWKF